MYFKFVFTLLTYTVQSPAEVCVYVHKVIVLTLTEVNFFSPTRRISDECNSSVHLGACAAPGVKLDYVEKRTYPLVIICEDSS